jgi:hypothetical protein
MDRPTEPLLGSPRDWAIDLAVAGLAGAFLGVIGPFGSFFNDAAAVRILYWVLAMWCATAVLGVTIRLSVGLAMRLRIPIILGALGGLVLVSGPLSMLVAAIARLFWPLISLTPLEWYGQCLVISTPFVLLHVVVRVYLVRKHRMAPRAVVLETAPVAEPALTGEVICLRMEDHYVRIHTAGGSRLVAGPFERVIAGLGDREGMRVHRSWWVSRAAVVGVEVDGRNLKLRLSNDVRAPVSRSSVAKLRQVGWLPAEL